MTATDNAPSVPKVIPFAGAEPPAQRYRPEASRIIAGDPAQSAAILYQSPDGRFASGIWECEPGTWRVVFTECEFCQILEGTIVVTGDDGSKRTFRAGDAFVSPAGFTGTWEVVERARKYFAYYE